jgi:hypothetical protein
MPTRHPSCDHFIAEFIDWVVLRYGADSAQAERAADLVHFAVKLRPEHVTALKRAAQRVGETPGNVLRAVLDDWMAAHWAGEQ